MVCDASEDRSDDSCVVRGLFIAILQLVVR